MNQGFGSHLKEAFASVLAFRHDRDGTLSALQITLGSGCLDFVGLGMVACRQDLKGRCHVLKTRVKHVGHSPALSGPSTSGHSAVLELLTSLYVWS